MWPSTYLYRRKMRKKDGPEMTFIARTVHLTVWATKCNHRLYLLLFYRFCCFSWCQPIMVNLLNYICWLTKPSGARIRRNYPFYYCLNGQQTDLSTIRATFLQIKQRSSELDGKLHRDVKLQVSYGVMKQSTLACSPLLTEERGQNFCSDGQQAKFVDRSSILSPEKKT